MEAVYSRRRIGIRKKTFMSSAKIKSLAWWITDTAEFKNRGNNKEERRAPFWTPDVGVKGLEELKSTFTHWILFERQELRHENSGSPMPKISNINNILIGWRGWNPYKLRLRNYVITKKIHYIRLKNKVTVTIDLLGRKPCCVSSKIWLTKERIELRTFVFNNLDRCGKIVIGQ